MILTATPGAGKTTRLPPEFLNAVSGKIAILEPRRVATIGAAQRISEERGWRLGDEVGYQVRFESKTSNNTRLVFMTDALLLRRLVDDPELKEFDLIVIDEFHERNLNQDVILGVIKELQELGSPIKLLVMSATLDVERLKEFLPTSQHVDVPGKVFPLQIRHIQQPLRPATDRDFFERVATSVLSLARETSGDILVFLPGVGEIQRTQELLEEKRIGRALFQLHGSMPLQDQKEILKPHDSPRVILTTNIAEASVTVPGVDTVIDTGLAKVMEVNLKSGFSRLDLTRIAQFNARQRAGRAARQKEGVCLRLWTAHDEATQAEEMIPECQRVDLSQTLLLLAHLGISDFSSFAWFDSPPQALLKMALESLVDLQALDRQGRLTDLGKKLMTFPLPPRLAAMLVLSENTTAREDAALVAALLQDRDILLRGTEAHSGDECDVIYRLKILDDFQQGKKAGSLHYRQAQTVIESAEQLERLFNQTPARLEQKSIHQLLIHTHSNRLSRRRGGTARGVMVGGRGVTLAKESNVKTSEFFLSLQGVDFPNQPDSTISMACGLTKQFVLEELKDQIQVHEDTYFDEAKGQFYARRVRRFKDLDLDDPVLTPIKSEDIGDRLVDALVSRWDWVIEKNENLAAWMQRWNFFVSGAPEFSEELSSDKIKEALQSAAFGKNKIDAVISDNLVRWIESVMDRSVIKKFHDECPSHFNAPSGHSHKIHYTPAEPPFTEIRLQEMFGVSATPRLGMGKTPLIFKLLAPNFRPVQVTADIASFWKNTYFEVRKELRSRYPKHSWPDDPLTALPVAKGTRRRT
jgi:ATP-dependent helicase HrpB